MVAVVADGKLQERDPILPEGLDAEGDVADLIRDLLAIGEDHSDKGDLVDGEDEVEDPKAEQEDVERRQGVV